MKKASVLINEVRSIFQKIFVFWVFGILFYVPFVDSIKLTEYHWDYNVEDTILATAISPDGNYIGVGTSKGYVFLFDRDGEVIIKYKTGDQADDIAMTSQGDFLVYSNDNYVYYFKGSRLYWKYSSSEGGSGSSIDVSSDGKYIIAGNTNDWVYLLDASGNLVCKYDTGPGLLTDWDVYVTKISADGKFIAAGNAVGVYFLSGTCKLLWKKEIGKVEYLDMPDDGSYVIVGVGNTVYKFTRLGSLDWKITINGDITALKVSNDGKYIGIGDNVGEVYLFTKEGVRLWEYTIGSTVTSIDLSSGESNILVGASNGVAVLFSNKRDILWRTSFSNAVHSVAITSNSQYFVVGEGTNVYYYELWGVLEVHTTPPGAKVYVDGSYAGTTPLTNYKLSPGEHEVEIKKEGYKEYTKTVSITAGEKTTLSASLVLLPSPSITTTPPASSSETSPAQASGSSNFNPMYIAGALIGLLLIGGIVAKAMGGKSKGKSEGAEAVPASKAVEGKSEEPEAPREVEKPAIPVPDFPSALLKRYEPLEFIGEGGFAKVFKVKRKKDGEIVALKIPRIDERTSKTFIKEVSTWLHLNHPNIVRLYDVDILPIPYLEMEYVEGVDVNGKLVRDLNAYPKPVPEGTALKLIKGVAEGLKYAHSKGIYHRDLKPLNILLKSDLTPKITDWGLAKIGTMSSSRSVLGYTPLYAAPEHLMPGKYGHTDERTDIWQLGVTFYELLTGKLPFEGYTYEEVFGKIVDETYKFTPPSKINSKLAKYDGIFEKLLAKRKEERYQSVDEFLKDLEKLEEAEKRKAELEKEVEELKKTLSKSIQALKKSTTPEEALRNRRLVVETLGKLALAYAELNKKAELLNTLNDLKFYTIQNLNDLMNAINTVEMLIREDIFISGDFIERLKVLVHSIKRENEIE